MKIAISGVRVLALRLWGALRRRRADDDIARELSLHLEMAEEELRRRGHSPEEAARLARVRFGGPDRALERMRDQRGLPPLDAFWLDIKLGLRMLRKHLGLTLIGGLAMAAAMTIGAAAFQLWHSATETTLPLDDGGRIVVIQSWNPATGTGVPASIADFEHWRETLHSVEDVGAFRQTERVLTMGDGATIREWVAQTSAAGFELARVAPLFGRFLLEEDDAAGAPPVLVIGYDAWQSMFAADSDVVGRAVQLDGVFHTVVGVMPEGFGFPVNHQYWTNERPGAADRVVVFARLAPGATLASAQAEVELAGLHDPAPVPDTGQALRPRVVPYVIGIIGDPRAGMALFLPLALPLLLIPPGVNIAILVYARTVARQGEFAARTALGATRGRIVAQVFIEVLVLAAGAAVLALALSPKLLDVILAKTLFGRPPFWMDFGFSYATIGYAAALAVVAASIAGAIPAMRATGRWTLAGLHSLGARSVPRLGSLWTALVVVQVALAAATLPAVSEIAWAISGPAIVGPRFAPEEYLTASLSMDASQAEAVRFAGLRNELVRRVTALPGVGAVTLADALPSQESMLRLEIERPAIDGDGESVRRRDETQRQGATAAFNRVDLEFFEAFDVGVLTGRGFTVADFEPRSDAIIVNRTFARRILGDENPLGQRIRVRDADDAGGGEALVSETQPWLEIVGVVEDFSAEGGRRTFYRPLPRVLDSVPVPDGTALVRSVSLAIHAAPAVLPDLPDRLHEIVAQLDPALRVDSVVTLDVRYEAYWLEDRFLASSLAGVMLVVVLFSAAGVYTLLAFAVVQRRREIGIRSALGAPPRALIAGIFRRVFVPVCGAAVVGGLAALAIDHYFSPILFEFREGGRPLPWVLPAAEALILVIGLLVVAAPARRALRIDPVEALREG